MAGNGASSHCVDLTWLTPPSRCPLVWALLAGNGWGREAQVLEPREPSLGAAEVTTTLMGLPGCGASPSLPSPFLFLTTGRRQQVQLQTLAAGISG